MLPDLMGLRPMGGVGRPNLTPYAQAPGYQAPPSALMQLLQRPGLSQALMAAGSSLLQSRDVPGSTLGGALGRALPVGMQAYQQGQRRDQYEEMLEGAPPELRQLLRMLGPERGLPLLVQAMQPPERSEAKVVQGALVDPDTGEVIYQAPDEPDTPPPLGAEFRGVLWGMGIDPDNATPEQRAAALERYEALKIKEGTGETPVKDLPVGVQSGIVSAQTVKDSIGKYKEIAQSWFQRSRLDRAAGQLGVPNAERDKALGDLESTMQEVFLGLKNLAELGVLAGPDMDILTDWLGDPTSQSAVLRDPEYTLTRIDQVLEFIDNKVRVYEQTYGIDVPSPGGAASSDRDPAGIL